MSLAAGASPRPELEPHLRAYVAALAADRPAFAHVAPEGLLFVAGAARRAARASVRGFAPPGPPSQARLQRPQVVLHGRPILYEICLRPRFFLAARPHERARILAHELWHIGPRFDGELHPERRHLAAPEDALEAALDAALGDFDPTRTSLWPLLCLEGELTLPAWLDRPPSLLPAGPGHRRRYGAEDLYPAIVTQR